MRVKYTWPATAAAMLVLALSALAMDDADMEDITYNHEIQTEDPDREVKDSLYSYKVMTTTTTPVTNATKRPLQCFFCSYDSKMPRLRTCLDPIKFASSINVSTSSNSSINVTNSSNVATTLSPFASVYRLMTRICRSVDDQCYTSVMFNATHEKVHRGCSSDCITSSGTNCCKSDQCNSHSVFAPERFKKVALRSSGGAKSIQASIFFIVTIMLVLHTTVRVAFV